MSRKSWAWKLIWMMILFSLTLGQTLTAFAQTEDEAPVDAATAAAAAAKQGTAAPGESSSIDTGKNYVFLPMLQSAGTADQVTAAATNGWVTVFYDEMCSFPSQWFMNDYNQTGDVWIYRTIDGLCTAQPSRYINLMNTYTYRTFSLAKAKDANIHFAFKMSAEPFFDYFVTEYTCDNGISWHGSPSSRSNPPPGWVARKLSLKGSACLKKTAVTVRFGFTTDLSVTGSTAPAIDYVWVEKLQ